MAKSIFMDFPSRHQELQLMPTEHPRAVAWPRTSARALCTSLIMSLYPLGALAAPPDKPAESLSWRDVQGESHSLAELSSSKAIVFVFVSIQCPVANVYTPRLIELG